VERHRLLDPALERAIERGRDAQRVWVPAFAASASSAPIARSTTSRSSTSFRRRRSRSTASARVAIPTRPGASSVGALGKAASVAASSSVSRETGLSK
jgi:hypothetical protein